MSTSTIQRTGVIRLHDTHIAVWEDPSDRDEMPVVEAAMRLVFRLLGGHLEGRGFLMSTDPIAERISAAHRKGKRRKNQPDPWLEWHRVGRKNSGLELAAETVGRTIKVEFFQNVANIENPNGGRYDFNKFSRMSRTIRLECAVEIAAAIRFLQTFGYSLSGDLEEPLPLSVVRIGERRVDDGLTPLERFNRGWGADRFKRDESGWPEASDFNVYGYKGRDGLSIKPGDTRYLYHRGRLVRGLVYPNMNGMWTVHLADGTYLTTVNAGELFSIGDGWPYARRKAISPKEQRARLQRELARETAAEKWERVDALSKLLAQMVGDQKLYYVLSLNHSKKDDGVLTWWCPGDGGYTFRLREAGRYTQAEVAKGSYDTDSCRAIPCDVVDKLAAPISDLRDFEATALDRRNLSDRVVRYRHLAKLKRRDEHAPKGVAA